jgi:hypothetical protein
MFGNGDCQQPVFSGGRGCLFTSERERLVRSCVLGAGQADRCWKRASVDEQMYNLLQLRGGDLAGG